MESIYTKCVRIVETDKDHNNAVIIAHHMRGYNGYFLASYLLDNGIAIQSIVYNGSKIM